MTAAQADALAPDQRPAEPVANRHATPWLLLGLAACLIGFGLYAYYWLAFPLKDLIAPVDIRVYRLGGLIALHHRPYSPTRQSPLYDWPGFFGLKFTYTPFAAMAFSVLGMAKLWAWLKLSVMVSVACMVATIWFTLGGLGHRVGAARTGGTLLLSAILLWTEPVQRVLWLGQIELVLMALVMWDLCQPDHREWKGVGVGIAAGIKLVPLIFIPYLVLTRRYRQAAVATGTFAATVAIGFADLPRDSMHWWFGGLFAQGSRTGFVGWLGNQSLEGIITRFAGSVAGSSPAWLVAAALTLAIGMASAVILNRAGHPVVGVLTCALVATLISPISWDHHWVWIVPGVTALASYGVRASRAIRWSLLAVAAATVGLFEAWPSFLSGNANGPGAFFANGIIWGPPHTPIAQYYLLGDQPWFPEYHWQGLQLVTGNLFILTGLAFLGLLAGIAVREVVKSRHAGKAAEASPAAPLPVPAGQPSAVAPAGQPGPAVS